MGVYFIEPGQGVERTRDGMHEIEETDWRKKEEGRRRRMENVNFLTCFAKKMFIAPFADFEDRTEWLLRFTESPSSFWLVISDWNRGVGIGNNHKSRRRRNCCSNKVDKLVAFRFVTSWELCQSFSPLFHSNRATFACVLRFSLTYTRFWTKNCFVFRYVIREKYLAFQCRQPTRLVEKELVCCRIKPKYLDLL